MKLKLLSYVVIKNYINYRNCSKYCITKIDSESDYVQHLSERQIVCLRQLHTEMLIKYLQIFNEPISEVVIPLTISRLVMLRTPH